MNKKGFTLIELIVIFLLGIVVVVGGLFIHGCNYVQKNGVKGVATVVWNGTNTPATNAPAPAPLEK